MSEQQNRELIVSFYDALNNPAKKDVRALVESVAGAEWRSYSSETVSKGREEFIQQVMGFGKLIPDLSWTIKEVISSGNKVIVRSEAKGTPAAPFMGVENTGKTFSIMTIDIHTIENGKLVAAHHVEDWVGAIRQLRG